MKLSLKEKLEKRLVGSKFRIINEKLYKKPNLKLDKKQIKIYHEGFSEQVKKWPVNPLNVIIEKLKNMKNLTIADLGCGEARLSAEFKDIHKVHSFDLHQSSKDIIKCDMEKTPLDSSSVDLVVCCLSLMKRNAAKSIKEANRICKINGTIYIAEVESRIENLESFVKDIEKIGFINKVIDTKNKFFVFLEFVKTKDCDVKSKIMIPLKPCNYKKR